MNDTPSLFDDTDDDIRGPFARYGLVFVAKGYAVSPLAPGTKWPPMTGTTGRYARGAAPDGHTTHESPKGTRRDLSADEVQRLADGDGRLAGLAVVLRPGCVVWDVDDGYKNEKGEVQKGAAALAAFVDDVGVALPPAPSMRAEDRPESSRRMFFRCPPDVVFRGQVCDDVEILQPTHRYSVGPGTEHPTAGVVRCYDADGNEIPPDDFPAVDELPMLPDEFVARLAKSRRQPTLVDSAPAATKTPTARKTPKAKTTAPSDTDEVVQWRKTHDAGTVTAPPEVWRVHLHELPIRYRAARDKTGNDVNGNNAAMWWTLCRIAEECTAGLYPADEALTVLESLYRDEASGNRPDDVLVDEYERRLPDAVAYALHDSDGRARVDDLRRDPERFHDDALRRQRHRDTDKQLDELHDESQRRRSVAKESGHADSDTEVTTAVRDSSSLRLPPPMIPDGFWEERPVFAHIARAARSQRCSPDAVLQAVLVRLAASSPHYFRLQLHDGAGPVGLSAYALTVGPKGVGKTKSAATAGRLLPTPPDGRIDLADDVPLGSGEGIVESYFGLQPVYDENGNDTGKTARAQVRNNVLVRVDEGTKLLHLQDRSGCTVGDTIRSAFVGNAPIGERNASAERTRVVPAGSYVLGLLVALQTDLTGPLFTDENESNGTPERFLWSSAVDSRMPDVRPSWPGPLRLAPPDPRDHDTGHFGLDDTVVVTMPPSFAAAVDEAEVRKHREFVTRTRDDDATNHDVVLRMKTACLLALLESRLQPTEDDVRLADIVVATSGRVQEYCKRVARQLAEDEAERRTRATERAAKRKDRAVRKSREHDALETAVGQYSRKVQRLSDDGVAVTRRDALRAVKGRLFDEVTRDEVHDTAVSRGFVIVDDDGYLQPGPKTPPDRH